MIHGKHWTDLPGGRGGFYREVFQTINDAVFVHLVDKDGSPGRFVEVNEVACQRLGYTREELLDMTPADIADAQHRTHLASFRGQLMAQGSARLETVHIASDGSRIPVESNVRLFEHGGQPAALSISRDITDRKRAEEQRQAALQQLKHIVEFLPDATFVVDRDRRVIAWNRAIEEMTGASQDTMIGKDWRSYSVSFYGRPEQQLLIDRIQDANERIASDYEFVRRENGRLMGEVYLPSIYGGRGGYVLVSAAHLFDADGAVVGAIETIRDITERKIAEKALQKRKAELSSIFRVAPVGIGVVVDRVFFQANDRLCEMVGYSRDELLGQSARCIYPDNAEYHYVGKEKYKQIRLKGSGTVETRWRRKNGDIIDVLLSSTPMDTSDLTAGVTFTALDITERKQAEKEKNRLKEQFHQAQRLESVGRLAGGVAHDLNNLLLPILGYSEMLLEDSTKGDSERESLEEIINAGIRARDLVRQLLAFSRKQTLAFKAVDLNRLLENFKKLLRRTIREDITIRWILSPLLPSIQGDPGQLEQVLMNLAVNAQDAMPDGGELTVETAAATLDAGDVEGPDGIEPGAYVVLTVSDTGLGMDPDTRKRLFDPFFTTKGPDKGTGLGLATVYGIVKQHDGNIDADSEPGVGSTFRIYLPVAGGKDCEVLPEAGKTVSAGGQEAILLVEDNPQVRRLALTILQRRGYAVLAAADGQEALALVEEMSGPLDLLLTDVVMPEMNGRQLYERVAAMRPGTRVLFMSGYSDDVIAHRGVMEPGLDYIQKPFSNKALAARVREVLDR